MPSFAHEIVADLFKTRPSLAAEILTEVLGIALPAYTEARLVSVDLTEIAPTEYRADVATWCARPIPLGPPGFVLTPPVLRRDAVPIVTEPAEAASRPELGMLSIMAHGDTAQAETIAGVLMPVIAGLGEERGRLYLDLLLVPRPGSS